MERENKRSEDQVIEEFRQLFGQQTLAQRCGRSPIHWLAALFSLGGERIAGLLERPSVALLAVSLSLVMLFVLVLSSPDGSSKVSADLNPTSESISESISRIEPTSPEEAPAQESVPETEASFIIRVGSFRNPLNAQRIVQSLRAQTLNVKTETLAGGLYVVTVGPFAARDLAEETALSVWNAVGLAPQILRLLPR